MNNSHVLEVDHERTATHVKEYISENKLFDIFEIHDIREILKYSKLQSKDFISLLRQSDSVLNATKLYRCTRSTYVSVDNFQDVISILESVQKYMKLRFLKSIINNISQMSKELSDSATKIQNLEKIIETQNRNYCEDISRLDSDVKEKNSLFFKIYQRNEKLNQEIEEKNKKITELTEENSKLKNEEETREIQRKIIELKNSNDFDKIYRFFDDSSNNGNNEMMKAACWQNLWLKTDDGGKNILHEASEKGNIKLVRSLIECNCSKETKDKNGWTPLIYAAKEGHIEIVKYLTAISANIEAESKNGWTPLIIASYYGQIEVVDYLVNHQANISAKNHDGDTPLICSSKQGHLDIVKLLREKGANVNETNSNNDTPLIVASYFGHIKVAEYLVSSGADIFARNKSGFNALYRTTGEVRNYLQSIGLKE